MNVPCADAQTNRNSQIDKFDLHKNHNCGTRGAWAKQNLFIETIVMVFRKDFSKKGNRD